MRLLLRALWCVLVLSCGAVLAQEFAPVARFDGAQSGAQDRFMSSRIDLVLSEPVPYRVFTLNAPRRLVVAFRAVDFRGAREDAFTGIDWISGAQFAPTRAEWSRVIFDLAEPVSVDQAGMSVDDETGTARITLVLRATSDAAFAQNALALDAPEWAQSAPGGVGETAGETGRKPLIVVVDPGHGGLDPGAQHGGVDEADVMLALALELHAALGRIDGVQPVLTRSDGTFVPLQARLNLARSAGADLFISLHADALEGLQATGASVYTLTERAAANASQRMVERHHGGELLPGVDVSGQGDEVANVLQDLVRVETVAAGERFADQLVAALRDTGAVLNARPRRKAALAVLNAAEFPSVLLEAGFLSNDADRARLLTQEGRAPIVEGITLAVARWAIETAALAPLMRQ